MPAHAPAPENVADLLAFLDVSPTPYHGVAEMARRLDAAGFSQLDEGEAWTLKPGAQVYVIRHEGSLIAWRMGGDAPAVTGMRMIGAHSDSPTLRIKPEPDSVVHGMRRLLIEPYGGLLAHTWYDRDCGLAGRLRLRDGRTLRVNLKRPLLRVPSLAIHLSPEVRETGFKPNAEQHMHPVLDVAGGATFDSILDEALEAHGATHVDVLTHDLMLYDIQGARLTGGSENFLNSARLDNLASCHAGLAALLAAGGDAGPTQVLAIWDHEEVGSRSASGASGAFLRDVLTRIAGAGEDVRRALSRSLLVSADMAHGVHPNYPDRHDGRHMPKLGSGPVIKWNTNQSYTSDAVTAGAFVQLCEQVGVVPQNYSHRNDMRCGSTIGPLASAALGVRTVDVGNPMLSMHSCREMCAASDHEPMIRVLTAHLEQA